MMDINQHREDHKDLVSFSDLSAHAFSLHWLSDYEYQRSYHPELIPSHPEAPMLSIRLTVLFVALLCVVCSVPDVAQDHGAALIANTSDMVLVSGGSFTMGSLATEQGRRDNEIQHQVSVSDFYIGKYDVTQGLYKRVMGTNPSYNKDDPNLPVEKVSWYDAVGFCNKLSEQDGLQKVYTINGTNVSCNWSASGYRLPTEAEWEYAAKGGLAAATLVPDAIYAGSNNIDQVAWYKDNSGGRMHPVGQKAPNALELYDMSGNVWQWCWDWYGNYSTAAAQTNPSGASSGVHRIVRGGSWYDDGRALRSAIRDDEFPGGRTSNIGFRLVRRP